MKSDTARLTLLALFAFGVLALVPATILVSRKHNHGDESAHLHPVTVTLPNGKRILCVIVTQKEMTQPSGVSCEWP